MTCSPVRSPQDPDPPGEGTRTHTMSTEDMHSYHHGKVKVKVKIQDGPRAFHKSVHPAYSDIHVAFIPTHLSICKNTYTLQSVHSFFLLEFYYQNDMEGKHTHTHTQFLIECLLFKTCRCYVQHLWRTHALISTKSAQCIMSTAGKTAWKSGDGSAVVWETLSSKLSSFDRGDIPSSKPSSRKQGDIRSYKPSSKEMRGDPFLRTLLLG